MLKSYLLVFFVSMVPLIELRGAIPIGLGMGLPILPTYLVCVVGNMIPVPFIYLFARKFLIWGYHKPLIGPICKFCIVKGEKGGRALEAKAGRGLVVALLLFVGIPLPGTGAWTGTLAGSILDMKFKDVVKACMGGVLLGDVADRGTTVLVSSHNLRELEDVCDHVGILNKGKVLLERSLSDLQDNTVKIQAAYAAAEEPALPPELEVLHRSAVGRVYTYIIRGKREDILHRMQALSPLLLEAIPLTLEEIFIYELGGADYAVREIIL